MDVICQYRESHENQPTCKIVAALIDLPVKDCRVNDDACRACLACGIAPQAPNYATASMAIIAVQRTGDAEFMRQTADRMKPHLRKATPVPVACILRGRPTRKVECKPCNAGAGGLMVDVFSCPEHKECTLNATGSFPVIKGCAGCQERLEKAYQIDARPIPQVVLDRIPKRGGPANNHAK